MKIFSLWAARYAWREWQMEITVRDHFHFVKTRYFVLFGFWLIIVPFAAAQDRGVIDDPAGSVNVQADNRKDAAIIAKVKTGEQVSFECKEGDKWCKVTLASGKSGWVPSNCIRIYFTKKDLQGKGGELGEANYRLARRAAQGDAEALKKFFNLQGNLDGAAAEEYGFDVAKVIHILGDDGLAALLRGQPVAVQMTVRNHIGDEATSPFESVEYLRRHFPKTSKIFFRREIVDWFSPDGRYAIRKVFSDEFDVAHSKVARAELIEKAAGKVIADLTEADTGTGGGREGDVLWAPDSKRFAFLPGDYLRDDPSTREADPLRGMIVYQHSGEVFSKIDLPASVHKDAEKASVPDVKNAVFIGEYIGSKPLRWVKPDVLALGKDYVYQINDTPDIIRRRLSGQDFPYVEPLRRPVDVLVTIGADGKITVERKLREHE